MSKEMISQAEADEEILSFDVPDDVPDEVLERVAAEQKALTVVYCTNPWYDCGLPQ
jgi:hypothetical protein